MLLLAVAAVASGCGSASSDDGVAALDDTAATTTPRATTSASADDEDPRGGRARLGGVHARARHRRPDPEIDERTRPLMIQSAAPRKASDDDASSEARRRVRDAVRGEGPPQLSDEQREELQETMLEFARACASTASTCPIRTSPAAAAAVLFRPAGPGGVDPEEPDLPGRRRRRARRSSKTRSRTSRRGSAAEVATGEQRRLRSSVRPPALAAVGLGAVGRGRRASAPDSSPTAATTDGAVATATVDAPRSRARATTSTGRSGTRDARTLVGSAPGTVTRLPEEGSVVTRGAVALRRERAGVRLLYGTMPLWRTLAAASPTAPMSSSSSGTSSSSATTRAG